MLFLFFSFFCKECFRQINFIQSLISLSLIYEYLFYSRAESSKFRHNPKQLGTSSVLPLFSIWRGHARVIKDTETSEKDTWTLLHVQIHISIPRFKFAFIPLLWRKKEKKKSVG